MSADLILVVMIALEKYVVTEPEKMQKYRKRMVYGLLLNIDSKKANELKVLYDKDGDGNFDEGEIKAMMLDVYADEIARMKENEAYVDKKLAKARAKVKAAKGPGSGEDVVTTGALEGDGAAVPASASASAS